MVKEVEEKLGRKNFEDTCLQHFDGNFMKLPNKLRAILQKFFNLGALDA